MSGFTSEPMLDMFIYETAQLIEQLEQLIISNERQKSYDLETINEIFRIMHTIKGSSAMMLFDGISTLTHTIEDMFFYIREENPNDVQYSLITDLVFESIDFIKVELEKIKDRAYIGEVPVRLIDNIKSFLSQLKQNSNDHQIQVENYVKQQYYITPNKVESTSNTNTYKAILIFEDDCGMENLRAFTVIHGIQDIVDEYFHYPLHLMEDEDSCQIIKAEGFRAVFKSDLLYEAILEQLQQTTLLKSVELIKIDETEYIEFSKISRGLTDTQDAHKEIYDEKNKTFKLTSTNPNIISVSVTKLDKLMDLVGELVISEAMVTENSDLRGLELDNFNKSARQLKKITSEIQDTVMSIRMIPLAATFLKMHRIVRDMSKKLGKEVELNIIGEETEVDKNIIEHISDPLMHLVRNAIDHGIETVEERKRKTKLQTAVITLEAKNIGSDVLIIVRDDGKGLIRDKILDRAKKSNILSKPVSEMTDKEVYNLILLPGFSTKDDVTEYSGRGVGMDVVAMNIQSVGGTISIDSVPDYGTTITLKIPLTLAIVGGMNIRVGNNYYTIPMLTVKESFKPDKEKIITNQDGNDMIMIRGQCYPILRLHEIYRVKTAKTNYSDGIFIMVEDNKTFCIFADELIGEQPVVVKALPNYIKNISKNQGLAGCTLLGDGSISLILDVAELN